MWHLKRQHGGCYAQELCSLGRRWRQSMLGRAKLFWLVAWFKQDELWMEQDMQEALLSLLLPQHLVVATWRVHSCGQEREAVLALRTGRKRGARARGCLGHGVRAGTRLALVTVCLWAQRAKLQLEETPPRSARLSPGGTRSPQAGRAQTPRSPNHPPSCHSPGLGDSRGRGRAAPLPVAPRDTASSSPSP